MSKQKKGKGITEGMRAVLRADKDNVLRWDDIPAHQLIWEASIGFAIATIHLRGSGGLESSELLEMADKHHETTGKVPAPAITEEAAVDIFLNAADPDKESVVTRLLEDAFYMVAKHGSDDESRLCGLCFGVFVAAAALLTKAGVSLEHLKGNVIHLSRLVALGYGIEAVDAASYDLAEWNMSSMPAAIHKGAQS